MAILTFDIGGTFVKYGVWDNESLKQKGKFKTPESWEKMKVELLFYKEKVASQFNLEGVAFSAPGSVNREKRQIEGESKVNYLHFFPIYDELETLFGLPVSFENDANCAALAEMRKGSAKDNKDVLFVIIGTGIGGTVIVNKKIVKGFNNYAGEFGFMLLDDEQDFGELASAVAMSKRYANKKGISSKNIDGKYVFDLARKDDLIAQEEVDSFFYYLTIGLYNLANAFDPEKIILGGGVSNLEEFLEKISKEFDELYERIYHNPYRPVIDLCTFNNDANLIGAVYKFIENETV